MPIRTTEDEVRGINTEADPDIDIQPHILTASSLVDEVCLPALKTDGTAYYDSARLLLIETWLAAHFAALNDPRTIIEQADRVREQFETQKVDLGLHLTRFGQHAVLLDTAGGLAKLQAELIKGRGKIKPKAVWLGTQP